MSELKKRSITLSQNDEIEIDLTDREKKILRFQMLSFILSFGLVLYPSVEIFSSIEKHTIYLLLGGWLLSAFSSILCASLLNWRNLFAVLSVALFFPPVWFLMCTIGIALSSQRTNYASELSFYLVTILFGFFIYFGLILQAEGYCKTDWKKL